jgi:hypothetical protein
MRDPFGVVALWVTISRSALPGDGNQLGATTSSAWTGLARAGARKHLSAAHGLSVEEYRASWNLPINHALVAPAYRKRRAVMAKQTGLGRNA